MATPVEPAKLEQLLECSICLSSYQDPRVLPCLHSYCLACLTSHVSSTKNRDGSFYCPQCREKCSLPQGGKVEGFPKNFFANTLKDIIPLSSQPKEDEYGPPILCQNYTKESAAEHDLGVNFCFVCGGYLCNACAEYHDIGTDPNVYHKVIYLGDAVLDGEEEPAATSDPKANSKCDVHDSVVTWFCETCDLPACAECMLENHRSHDTKKLSAILSIHKEDMSDVSKMATKHVKYLQDHLAKLDGNEKKMEEELTKASKNVSQTADNLCKAIRKREAVIKKVVKNMRESAKKDFAKAKNDVKTALNNTSALRSSVETLRQAPSSAALTTAVQAPTNKQKFIEQKELPIPVVEWTSKSTTFKDDRLATAGFLGNVNIKTIENILNDFAKEDIFLEAPIKTIKLEYTGKQAICGLAPIFNNYVCIVHFFEGFISVYDGERFVENIRIPGIKQFLGLIPIDGNQGKLAAVDGSREKVHFVTLSPKLKVIEHFMTDVPLIPERVGISTKREIVVSRTEGTKTVLLSPDGNMLSQRDLDLLTDGQCFIRCVAQTKLGYVACDRVSREVKFTDASGHVYHTSTDCEDPWSAVSTSWGHVLIADSKQDEIKVFSNTGHFLGTLRDNNHPFVFPYYIIADETKRLLYVAGGKHGAFEIRIYNLRPGQLQPLPTVQNITELSVDINLADV